MRWPVCLPFGGRCNSWVEVLDKSQCNLSEVPPEVSRWSPSLRELCLDGNQISELTEDVLECYALQKLSISQNRLLQLPKGIKQLRMLQELYLVDNELSDLPMELEQCVNLRVLDLRLNVFTRLPVVLTYLASLTHLSLYNTAIVSLPNDFGKLTNLRFLDLRENQLRMLPAAISQLERLKHLDVGKNELVELPFTIGLLREIEELYVDNNYLSLLPHELLNCEQLKILDISENEIKNLPVELGNLENLTELLISNNEIVELPHSIGRLTKLQSLCACNNQITELKATVGNCHMLIELRVAKNKLKELSTTVGELKNLEILALDENRLAELTPAIGGCEKLKFLTLRNNELRELPFEIGRLENICVIDVADNSLAYLPYSISVLSKLRALWLSIDQRAPLPRLTIAQVPVTRVKVLTCYLLPQGKYQAEITRKSKSPYGVSFSDDVKDESDGLSQFQRKGTPHPKPRNRHSVPRKSNIDGHYVHHSENTDDNELIKGTNTKDDNSNIPIEPQMEKKDHMVKEVKPILRGVMHVKKDPADCRKNLFFSISRDSKQDFGISFAGGCNSKSCKNNDSGVFISKMIVGSPAESAGLLPGDKIIFFNGVDVRNENCQVVMDMMQKVSALELIVQRSELGSRQEPYHKKEHIDKNEAQSLRMHSEADESPKVPREADGTLSSTLNNNYQKQLLTPSSNFAVNIVTDGKQSESSSLVAAKEDDNNPSINLARASHNHLVSEQRKYEAPEKGSDGKAKRQRPSVPPKPSRSFHREADEKLYCSYSNNLTEMCDSRDCSSSTSGIISDITKISSANGTVKSSIFNGAEETDESMLSCGLKINYRSSHSARQSLPRNGSLPEIIQTKKVENRLSLLSAMDLNSVPQLLASSDTNIVDLQKHQE